jgi:lysophospholipase L1-like esterase
VLGTFMRKVYIPGQATIAPPSEPANRIIVYGDSIAVGANATVPTSQGWTNIVRATYAATGGLAVEGWGYRALKDDAVDATARAAFVARLLSAYPGADTIWLAIGTNDYGIAGKWNAADFGTAYAALLVALNAAFPAANIYAQTPIERTVETANAYGDTLGAYRTAIGTAAGGKAYVTLVDGTAAAYPQAPGDLADGVHPTDAGHIMYADAVEAELGL